ncbi:MAG: serine hydrolase domain-containing protein [Phenylobacterium sp.]|uniref:serine hydrolase domain-containing protein n=1 Tax=Phenylobacterium sp. TaxID=1871053 RepID=UPI002736C552|nr:serine hydrolase domain-containing protein [Phenylobacterium sp.]MDP3747184.1 serine hydrolase domain-containing protein [Phenylobacterium sp.]
MQAYLAAVNTDGETAAEAFRNDHIARAFAESVPRVPFVGYFTNQRRVMGGLDLVELRVRNGRTAELLLRDRLYGALHGLELGFEETPEARVTTFEPGPAPLWAPKPKAHLTAGDVGAQARGLMDRGCRAGVFSGAVLVAKGDEVLFEAACGQANRRYGVANTSRTRLNLGSMNKMFTAIAVMQLVETGQVSLDDPLSKYADESWLPAEIGKTITIRHLLRHTSGLGSFLGRDFEKTSRRLYREVADYKPLVRGETPAFPPGTQFKYSDTGMLLLGVVIEQASGETYFDYARAHIFGPAAMKDTDSWPMDEPTPDLAMGYGWAPRAPLGWRENTMAHVFRGTSAGGGYSTVGDLHRFARAAERPASLTAFRRGPLGRQPAEQLWRRLHGQRIGRGQDRRTQRHLLRDQQPARDLRREGLHRRHPRQPGLRRARIGRCHSGCDRRGEVAPYLPPARMKARMSVESLVRSASRTYIMWPAS